MYNLFQIGEIKIQYISWKNNNELWNRFLCPVWNLFKLNENSACDENIVYFQHFKWKVENTCTSDC